MTLTLSGDGALDHAKAPDLAKFPLIERHFRIQEVNEQTEGNERRFVYTLRAMDTELREFPPVTLSYFDTEERQFVSLRSKPVPIKLEKGGPFVDIDLAANKRRQEAQARRGNIFGNITEIEALSNQTVQPDMWLLGLLGLALAYGAVALAVGRLRRYAANTAFMRRRRAPRTAIRQLRAAVVDLDAGRVREGADRVRVALLGFAADVADIASVGMTPADACRQLETLGIAPELIERLRGLLQACESVRFGASAGLSDSLGRDAEALVQAIAAYLKKAPLPPLKDVVRE